MLSKKILLMMACLVLLTSSFASAAGRAVGRQGGKAGTGDAQGFSSCVVASGELVASADPLGYDAVLSLKNVCGDRVLIEGEADLVLRYSGAPDLLLGSDDDLSDGARFQVAPSSVPLAGAREVCLVARGAVRVLDRRGEPSGDALPFDEERCFAAPGSIDLRDLSLR